MLRNILLPVVIWAVVAVLAFGVFRVQDGWDGSAAPDECRPAFTRSC